MSIARHHAEWLSLVEVSGPFLSMPVLMRVFPQGLDAPDPDLNRVLQPAYEEWADNQSGLNPDPSIHTQWLRFVLTQMLRMPFLAGADSSRPSSLLTPAEDAMNRSLQKKETATGLVTGTRLPNFLFVNFREQHEELHPDYALLSASDNMPRLLIQQYPFEQKLDKPIAQRHWPATPAERMRQLLTATGVRLGLVTNGEHWMLVDAPRNETTGFISWYAHLWLEEPLTLRAFRSLLHMGRFFGAENETLEAMLAESVNSQQEVTDRLGFQVRRAVEVLIQSLDRLDKDNKRLLLQQVSETQVYEAALTVMMRLVFLLSAEERKLLPLGEPLYDRNYAASTLQSMLREKADQDNQEYMEHYYDAWNRLLSLFRVVYGGVEHQDLNLRAYDGHLFDPDRFPFLEGRAAGTSWRTIESNPLLVNNRTVLHLLEALQILQVKVPGGGTTEARRLSFRALDIEQIGHVYEGLLDHTARRATAPMLGLIGSQDEGVELALALLEAEATKGKQALLDLLKERTGRTVNALQKALTFVPNLFERDKLRLACDNDDALLQRVLPFAGLLRNDSFGLPLVINIGSIYMTQGTDRRTTGTHYTPRSLTEPLVQHTLDPLVYTGPAEGLPQEQWQLHTAADILNLKVCDMAMGSGAFLVQACRYLAEKLVQAWEDAEQDLEEGRIQITPEGKPATGALNETLLPLDTDERLALARRLVAERCLYGVDKNPMAVEMAKLSLWLITLDKDRPFTFLDHALRCGDSLLGVNLHQLTHWSMDNDISDDSIRQTVWIQQPIKEALATALKLRRQIRALSDETIENVEKKTRLLIEAEEAMALVKLGADLLIATTLIGYSKHKPENVPTMPEYYVLVTNYEAARKEGFTQNGRTPARQDFRVMRQRVDTLLGTRNPFHWPLEYPEAFVEAHEEGFSAMVSNPPFQGGQKITGVLGTDYRDYLVDHLAYGKRGSADLSAYFFLKVSQLVRENGQSALLATNTIAQGDTREVGLDQLVAHGWSIPRAIPSRKWPGTANLEVAHLWLRHGDWNAPYSLNEKNVDSITAFLTASGIVQGKPYVLASNRNKSFIGSYVLGMGFVLEPEEAQALITKDTRNRDVLFPYLNGEDLNSRPDQSSSRWVINFHDWPLEVAETYPNCMKIVREKVKPERDQLGLRDNSSAQGRAHLWWRYGRNAPALYSTIADMRRVLAIPLVSKFMISTWEPTDIVYSHALGVIAAESMASFTLIQCTFHDNWARLQGSTLETRMRYTPSDCFETFPFPSNLQSLDDIGERYYSHRQSIMQTRQEGLTKTYNRFHNPRETAEDIVRLRELHWEMDEAVASAYGWHDLVLDHGFHETKQGLRYTVGEDARREVLGRLLALNHERYAEEVAQGLHDKGTKGKKGAKGKKGLLETTGVEGRQQAVLFEGLDD